MDKEYLSIPSIAFITSGKHDQPGISKNRTVIFHFATFTLFELITKDGDGVHLYDGVKRYEFEYVTIYGEIQTFILAIHFTNAINPLTVFQETADWYRDHLSKLENEVNKKP